MAGGEQIEPVSVTDYHTAGEPFRIVTGGAPEIAGATVLERRAYAQANPHVDRVRQLLVNEPRGHADMYGGFLVPANDDGAHFGVLFWHKDGYSTACGHGTIALGAWAVRSGLVAADPSGVTDVIIDVPSGRVVARVTGTPTQIESVSFRNVASYVVGRGIAVATSRGEVAVDVSYGGAAYASVAASAFGLQVTPGALRRPDRDRPRDQVGAQRDRVGPAPQRSTARRHLRHDPVRRSRPDRIGSPSAQRHRLRRRRGRPLAVRVGHLGPARPAGRGRAAGRWARRWRTSRSSARSLPAGSSVSVPRPIGPTYYTEVEGNAFPTGTATFTLDPHDPIGLGFTLR